MDWVEPRGYASWRYKTSRFCLSKVIVFLLLAISFVSLFSLVFWDLGVYNPSFEGADLTILQLSIIILCTPLYHWLNPIIDFRRHSLVIYDTCVIRSWHKKARRADIYLNEISSLKFELIKWNKYEFYNCYVSLKPMRSTPRSYFRFGIDVEFFEKNQEEISQALKYIATAQESLSAPIND